MERKLEISLLCVFVAILVYQLMVNPIVGIANNGDFFRVLEPAGLSYSGNLSYEQKYWNFINTDFSVTTVQPIRYFTSELFIVKCAQIVNAIIGKYGLFDIRFVAIVGSLLLTTAYGVLLFGLRRERKLIRILIGLLALVFFCDGRMLMYLNSFYAECATFLYFFAFLAIYIALANCDGLRCRLVLFVLLFIDSLCLVCSKTQNVVFSIPLVLGLPFLCFSLFGGELRRMTSFIRLVLVSTPSLFLALVTIWYVHVQTAPFWKPNLGMKESNVYNMVFQEILPHSPNPRNDLIELGLTPEESSEYSKWSGTTPWDKSSVIYDDKFDTIFFSKVGVTTIYKFYLAHPMRLWDLLDRVASHGLTSPRYGNFEAKWGYPPRTQTQSFILGTRLDEALPHSAVFFLAFIVFNAFYSFYEFRKAEDRKPQRAYSALNFALAVGAGLMFAAVALGDSNGFDETAKQLFPFNLLFNVCLIFTFLNCLQIFRGLVQGWMPGGENYRDWFGSASNSKVGSRRN